jgi:hypothetical protein
VSLALPAPDCRIFTTTSPALTLRFTSNANHGNHTGFTAVVCPAGFGYTDGRCVPALPSGSRCSGGTVCDSGPCLGGYCCGPDAGPLCTACSATGVCSTCAAGAGTGYPGYPQVVLVDGACRLAPGGTCSQDGECSSGACRYRALPPFF